MKQGIIYCFVPTSKLQEVIQMIFINYYVIRKCIFIFMYGWLSVVLYSFYCECKKCKNIFVYKVIYMKKCKILYKDF